VRRVASWTDILELVGTTYQWNGCHLRQAPTSTAKKPRRRPDGDGATLPDEGSAAAGPIKLRWSGLASHLATHLGTMQILCVSCGYLEASRDRASRVQLPLLFAREPVQWRRFRGHCNAY
jgi:hypothetical protein